MKKAILAVVAAVVCASAASAQDLLVKRNGEQLKVRIDKITSRKVEYYLFKTYEQLYTVPTKEVEYILYPDGDRDVFSKRGERTSINARNAAPAAQEPASDPRKPGTAVAHNPGEHPRWFGPVHLPDGNDSAPLVQRYSVGDIYECGGVKGIVILTHEDGLHGTVMSLDEASLAWSTRPRKHLLATGATDKADGRVNMQRLSEHIEANNLKWSDFPAFKWCRDKGEGWYLPSLHEVYSLGTIFNGGTRTFIDRKHRKAFNRAIVEAGGRALHATMFYHSSTENEKDRRYAYYSHMSTDAPHSGDDDKGNELFVRAFYRF